MVDCEVICACGCETHFLLTAHAQQRAVWRLPRLASVRIRAPEHALWYQPLHNPDDPTNALVTCVYPGAVVVSEAQLHSGPARITFGIIDEGRGPALALVMDGIALMATEFRAGIAPESLALLRDTLSMAACHKGWSDAGALNLFHPIHDVVDPPAQDKTK
jgi:hypothetical protein